VVVNNVGQMITRELCLEDQGRMKEYVNGKFEVLRDYVDDTADDIRTEACNNTNKLEGKIDRITWILIGGMVSIILLLIEIAFKPLGL